MQEAQERMLDKNHERPVESGVSCADFCEFILFFLSWFPEWPCIPKILSNPVFRKFFDIILKIVNKLQLELERREKDLQFR